MTDIPDDIMKVAQDCICSGLVGTPYEKALIGFISRALLAERTRCGGIVEHMANKAAQDSVIFDALGVEGVGHVMGHAIRSGLCRAFEREEIVA